MLPCYSKFADAGTKWLYSFVDESNVFQVTRYTTKLRTDVEQKNRLRAVIFLRLQVLKQLRTDFKVRGVGSSLGKEPFSPRSSPLWTFREEELLQLSDRNSKLMT